ncbi:hypothetical protein HI914_05376 [Erysiphe necator]|nr:hypothetical protein HI914_05376 [Erysiphe necator]
MSGSKDEFIICSQLFKCEHTKNVLNENSNIAIGDEFRKESHNESQPFLNGSKLRLSRQQFFEKTSSARIWFPSSSQTYEVLLVVKGN